METPYAWQPTTLERLINARGQRLVAGELFAEIMDQIPLHHGGRVAHHHQNKESMRHLRHRERPLSPVQLRWHAFRTYLVSLNLKFDPPLAPRKPLKMSHHVTALSTHCHACGKVFVGTKKKPDHHQGCRPRTAGAEPEPAYALGRVVYLANYRRRA